MLSLPRCLVLALTMGILAACEPSLPQPFRPAELPPLTEPGIRAGLIVTPVEGATDGVALAEATADALREVDVAATTDSLAAPAYRLKGRADASGANVRIEWTVEDAAGHKKATASQPLTDAEAVAWRAGDRSVYASLAKTAADDVAAAMTESKAKPTERPLIAIPEVTGAPGDGPRTLQRSMAYVLRKRGLNVTESIGSGAEARLVLLGSMRVVKGSDHAQVQVAWTLSHANGSQIGTVSQANNVPAGLFDTPWGDVAYTIAESAADGVVNLVDQATSPTAQTSSTSP